MADFTPQTSSGQATTEGNLAKQVSYQATPAIEYKDGIENKAVPQSFLPYRTRFRRVDLELEERFHEIRDHVDWRLLSEQASNCLRGLLALCEALRCIRVRIDRQQRLCGPCKLTESNLSTTIAELVGMRIIAYQPRTDGIGFEFEIFPPTQGFWQSPDGNPIPFRMSPADWTKTISDLDDFNAIGQLKLPGLVAVIARKPTAPSSARQNPALIANPASSIPQNSQPDLPALEAASAARGSVPQNSLRSFEASNSLRALKSSKRKRLVPEGLPEIGDEELRSVPVFRNWQHYAGWIVALEKKYGGWMGTGDRETWADSYGGQWWARYQENATKFRAVWNEALSMARESRITDSIGATANDLWDNDRV